MIGRMYYPIRRFGTTFYTVASARIKVGDRFHLYLSEWEVIEIREHGVGQSTRFTARVINRA